MAEKSGSGQSKSELRRRIASSREAFARDLGGLQYELDFPLKIKKSFQRNTIFWVGSALALGLCVALLRARPHKVFLSAPGKKMRGEKKLLDAGLLLSAIKLASPLIRPIVMSYIGKKVAQQTEKPAGRR